MRNKIETVVTAWALAAVCGVCAAGAGQEDVTSQRFPDADAVVLEMFEDIAYNPDGTFTSDFSESIKILTEKGRREEAELELHFSARYSRAELLEVTITDAEGARRRVDVAATTKETTDNSSASANIYDPMARKLVCTVPGLKVGDILSYRTRRTMFASRIKDQWADSSALEWSCPILKATVRITSPADRPLRSVALRHSLGNVTYAEERLEDGRIVRTWTAKDSPQMFPEPDMPPQHTQVQGLLTSTAADWREISRWYWDVSLPHLEKTTEAITNKVLEIIKNEESRMKNEEGTRDQGLGTRDGQVVPHPFRAEEKIGASAPSPQSLVPNPSAAVLRAIYKWVAQEVRYMGLTMEDTSPGYAPHDVDITFENRYGVCRDKAALLVAMLRIAGFEAYPVLIHAGAKMDDEVPMPYFNHAIACIADGSGGYILMDPTDESSRDLMPAYLSDRSYLVARPEGEGLRTSPVPPAESNAVRIESDGTLNQDGSMLLRSRIEMTGINDNVYRQVLLRRRKEARRKMIERSLMAVVPGAELLDLEILPENLQDTTQPLSFNLTARLPETLIPGETRTTFTPPMLSRAFGTANWLLEGKTSLESRKYPLVIDSTAMVEENLKVNLNGAVGRALTLPRSFDVAGDYACARTCAVEGDAFTMHRRFAVNAVEFSPAAYLEMRERIKEVEAAERERPVFASRRFAGANARILLSREDVGIASPRDWVITNTVTEQVLSYDGKKSLSELKFDYNPTWTRFEVLSATVSNQAGRVVAATDREMNTFDCSWAAGAPRYPASKRLIVNLPGVEVGSVISYTTVTTVTNAPVEFYRQWFFDSQEPTDEVTVAVNGEETTVRHAKMISAEPLTAAGELWRERKTVTSNDFRVVARRLRKAADVRRLKCDGSGERPWGDSVKSIRDWMAKHVRVAGPALYETPLEAQMTDPAVVVRERYGSRLDYIRTMCALMRGAGFEADVVFAALDAGESAVVQRRDMYEEPCAEVFRYPLCRVRERKGGFLWFGGTTSTYYIGTETEYAPLGATSFDGSHYLDPETGDFGVVEAQDDAHRPFERQAMTLFVRENGAVDFDIEMLRRGPGVAAFRKKYAEMLPEDRLRHHQELLGDIAQAASATSELETDIEGYPATMSFKAFVPNYAVVADDLLTVALPTFLDHLFPLSGGRRENPIGVPAAEAEETVVRVVFPEGYTEVEQLPDAFVFHDPADGTTWYENRVETAFEDEGRGDAVGRRLVVTVTRTRCKRPYAFLSADYAALLRDWSRLGNCRASRSITVRKP